MIEREGFFNDGEGGVLREGIEPRLTHPLIPSGGGEVGRGALDGPKHEELFVEAEVDPLEHVAIGEPLDEDRFAAAIVVDDLQRLTEFRTARPDLGIGVKRAVSTGLVRFVGHVI